MTMSHENFIDDEIGENNMFKRGIEDAIADNRPIAFSEFTAFMSAIGPLVPGFVTQSIPKILFANFGDGIKATKQAIEFIKSHPSLPVAFDIKRGISTLQDHLIRQETFSALQQILPESELFCDKSWLKFRTADLCEAAVDLAKAGWIHPLHVLMRRHSIEVLEGLKARNLDLVSGIVSQCPIVVDTEPQLIRFVEEEVIPNLVDLTSLALSLTGRARILGESDPEIAVSLLKSLGSSSRKAVFPLEYIKQCVRESEKEEVDAITRPVFEILGILISAKRDFRIELDEHFNYKRLEEGRAEMLEAAADRLLEKGLIGLQFDEFLSFCEKFNVETSDEIISRKIKHVKDQMMKSYKRMRSAEQAEDEQADSSTSTESVLSLLSILKNSATRCDCLYVVLTAVHSLNLPQAETEQLESLALDEVNNISPQSEEKEILKSYMGVLHVHKALARFEQYSFISERPDYLMNRDNVLSVVADLSAAGELETVELLAQVFPFYVNLEESALIRAAAVSWAFIFGAGDLEEVSELKNILLKFPPIHEKLVHLVLSEPVHGRALDLLDLLVPLPDSREVAQLSLLYRDFNLNLSREALQGRLQSGDFGVIDTFSDLIGHESIEKAAKLERAKLLFDVKEVKTQCGDVSGLKSDFEKLKNRLNVSKSQLVEFLSAVRNAAILCDTHRLCEIVEEVLLPLQSLIDAPNADEPSGETDVCCDEILLINARKKSPTDCNKLDLASLEVFFRVQDFLSFFSLPILPGEVSLLSPSRASIRASEFTALANRAQWGVVLDAFSIPFSRDCLLESASDKTQIKKILIEVFPALVVKSGYDTALLEKFASDFGKPFDDILIKALEIAFSARVCKIKLFSSLLDTAFDRSIILHKLHSFVLPGLKRNEDIACLTERILAKKATPEWARIDQICSLAAKISFDLNLELPISHLLRPADSGKLVTDLLSQSLKASPATLESSVDLARLTIPSESLSQIVFDLLYRIAAFPEVMVDGTYSPESAILAIQECLSADSAEKLLKALLQAIPLSESLLKFAIYFQNRFSGISCADLKLLQTRLTLKQFNLNHQFEEKVKELNFSMKKVIEFILFNYASIPDVELLISKLAEIHSLDTYGMRKDIAKRWIAQGFDPWLTCFAPEPDEEPFLSEGIPTKSGIKLVKTIINILAPVKQPDLISMMLKLFFSAKVSLHNRLCSFYILFSLYAKSAVLHVYNNSIDDLVGIQKNLTYLYLLSEHNKVIKPLEYKDFVAFDKTLVLKNIINAGDNDMLHLAAALVADFDITDFILIEKLEERLKLSVGISGCASFRNY